MTNRLPADLVARIEALHRHGPDGEHVRLASVVADDLEKGEIP